MFTCMLHKTFSFKCFLKFRHVVLGFLVELFSYFIDTMKKQRKAEPNLILHLLKMYSVVHFLRGDCKPFQSVSFEVSKVALSDPHQAIKAFQKIMNLQSGYVHIQ